MDLQEYIFNAEANFKRLENDPTDAAILMEAVLDETLSLAKAMQVEFIRLGLK